MPRFRIQSNLHLDGFQMLDACLENVTSFEGLDDKNDGRIVFLNGSSGNQSNLHPAVCYGRVFKGLAYLDDLEALTNGEGSLGTRVKALEDMLGLQDVTDVIDTWNDVKEFFANVDEGLNLMTMLDGKLDTKGGIITGKTTIRTPDFGNQLCLDITNDSFNVIRFQKNGTNMGFLGFNSSDEPIYADKQGQSSVLLHAGNVGDYALKYTYTGSPDLSTMPLVNTFGLWQGVGAYIRFGISDSYNIALRARQGVLQAQVNKASVEDSDWKTIAFTDSTVAAAKRLVDSNNSAVVHIGESGFYIGDNTYKTLSTSLMGNSILFRTGSSAQTAMTITEEGNVLVKTSSTVSALNVGGGVYLYGLNSASPTLGKRLENSLTVGAESYGVQFWSLANGTGGIQVGRFDGTATAYALNLNPLGGAVNVGEGGLNVAGNISLTYAIESDGREMLRRYDSGLYLGQGTAVQGGLPTNIFGKEIRFLNSGGTRSLVISDEGVASFSSRVLIGGATDDGTSALQVNGSGIVITDTQATVEKGVEILFKETRRGCLGAITAVFEKSDREAENVAAGSLRFYTSNHAEPKERMRITPNGNIIIRATDDDGSGANLQVAGLSAFNGGALIPTGQKLTIGDANGDHATIEYDSIAKAIKVDGNLFTTGTNASGGKADAQQGGTGGNAEVYEYTLDWGTDYYEISNPKGSINVIVQVYEWNANDNTWDMILTDVSVTANIITVTFGRPTSVDHMVTVV